MHARESLARREEPEGLQTRMMIRVEQVGRSQRCQTLNHVSASASGLNTETAGCLNPPALFSIAFSVISPNTLLLQDGSEIAQHLLQSETRHWLRWTQRPAQ